MNELREKIKALKASDLRKYSMTIAQVLLGDELDGIMAIVQAELESAVADARIHGAEELAALLLEGSRKTGTVNVTGGLEVFKRAANPSDSTGGTDD